MLQAPPPAQPTLYQRDEVYKYTIDRMDLFFLQVVTINAKLLAAGVFTAGHIVNPIAYVDENPATLSAWENLMVGIGITVFFGTWVSANYIQYDKYLQAQEARAAQAAAGIPDVQAEPWGIALVKLAWLCLRPLFWLLKKIESCAMAVIEPAWCVIRPFLRLSQIAAAQLKGLLMGLAVHHLFTLIPFFAAYKHPAIVFAFCVPWAIAPGIGQYAQTVVWPFLDTLFRQCAGVDEAVWWTANPVLIKWSITLGNLIGAMVLYPFSLYHTQKESFGNTFSIKTGYEDGDVRDMVMQPAYYAIVVLCIPIVPWVNKGWLGRWMRFLKPHLDQLAEHIRMRFVGAVQLPFQGAHDWFNKVHAVDAQGVPAMRDNKLTMTHSCAMKAIAGLLSFVVTVVSANKAFGGDEEDIDMEALWEFAIFSGCMSFLMNVLETSKTMKIEFSSMVGTVFNGVGSVVDRVLPERCRDGYQAVAPMPMA